MTSTLLTEAEAAPLLRVSRGTLRIWRCTKRYPLRFVKIGSKVFYREEDLQKFIEVRTNTGIPAAVKAPKRRTRAA
jgi:excisionase family DNA binding protein